MPTRVHNIHHHGIPANGVYIGRAGHGQDGYFGNPITIGQVCRVCGHVHRRGGQTLPCFERYARERLQVDPIYRARIAGLAGRDLYCFCAPKPCHGHTLAQLAEELCPTSKDPA